MFWIDFIVDYIVPIVGSLAAIGALFIAWAELSDLRRANLDVKFAPPSPEAEIYRVQKLRLVITNNGRGIAKNVYVSSLTPNLKFGYINTGKKSFSFKEIGVDSEDFINCFDLNGDILSQEYIIDIKWSGFLFRKHKSSKRIFWGMFADDYPPLSNINVYSPSCVEMLNT